MTTSAAVPTASLTEWSVCGRCRSLLYGRRLDRNLRVCPECGHHEPLSAPQRIAQLFDEGSVRPLDVTASTVDRLGFVDSRPYPLRLAQARDATGLDEAVVCVRGTVHGRPLFAAVMDFRFLGGSLGTAVGELITQTAERARDASTPLLIVAASGGARMQEGALSLMQMAKTASALRRLDEAGVLTVCLVTDPTYGGVAASFATLCDVIIAEPGARLGFAGPRVIAQTMRAALPEGFQTAEFLLARGMIDGIRPRTQLRETLGRLLLTRGDLPGGGVAPIAEPAALADPDPWEQVRTARHLGRPTTLDYAGSVLDTFQELHGDRTSGDDPAIVGGLGRIGGQPVMLIGTQKGHTPADLAARNFGMATPAGYRKAARLMRMAAKLGVPVLTLIDTPGAYHGMEAEENGQAIAIAENLRLMAGLPVPVIATVTGEGGSGGALALGVADRVLMASGAIYSVISPEGCAAILWKSAAEAPRAAAALGLRPRDLVATGVVDAVVPEPDGGAHTAPAHTASRLRAVLVHELSALLTRTPEELVARRHARFRALGVDEGGTDR
ncbi:acetyl-CoA carboxylase carboxyltransferase subunit alpha [Catenuloplanes atrovinosus]|uniref:Multifunctional fusion protein n=1 Tax=Catenuloplanes atrovinosus TaxID=137266 RepID=A0AAE3YS49_9ACTN|nr:acetyl-CoA carboxylase carboxyltransferase subunit alpha [Catenuloplanes atrovinosus]MDR7276786.1 acetyl-CoA carboxylase carboxyl transferase subunit beta [Catenuloplanes atrovinosus]